MPVRSAALGVRNSSPSNAVHVVYTCPSGRTAIVKDVRVSYASGAVTRCVVFVSSGAADVSLMDRAIAAGDTPAVEGFVVLEPGDTLSVYTEGGVVVCWVSGAELDGVA